MRDSRVPIDYAPPLTVDELQECDDLVATSVGGSVVDLRLLLVQTFRIPSPMDFERRLAEAIKECKAGDGLHSGHTHQSRYWFRVANTYSILFVAEAVDQRYRNPEFRENLDTAWGYYNTAVKYAESMEKTHTKTLVGFLDKELGRCGALLKLMIKEAVDDAQEKVERGQRKESPRAHIAWVQAQRMAGA